MATVCCARTSSGLRGDPQCLDLPCAHPLARRRRTGSGRPGASGRGRRGTPRHLVAGASDPLQPAGDRRRRLDLHDQIDGAHVDAELEGGSRDDAGRVPAFSVILDPAALLAGDRAVVRARDEARRHRRQRLPGPSASRRGPASCRRARLRSAPGRRTRRPRWQLRSAYSSLSRAHQPLRQRAGVGEHDGRPVLRIRSSDALLDVRPDRVLPCRVAAWRRRGHHPAVGHRHPDGADLLRALSSAMSSTGTTIVRSRLLAGRRDDRDRRAPPRNAATSSGGRTVADRPIRCAGFGRSSSVAAVEPLRDSAGARRASSPRRRAPRRR